MRHASLFSSEHISFACSSSRSRWRWRAAANSGSTSAAFCVRSSRDRVAVAFARALSLTAAAGEGETGSDAAMPFAIGVLSTRFILWDVSEEEPGTITRRYSQKIGYPERVEQIAGTDFLLAVVLAQINELEDISVPGLKVDGECSGAFVAPLIDVYVIPFNSAAGLRVACKRPFGTGDDVSAGRLHL